MKKLKLNKHRVHVTDKYISDGYTLIVKEACKQVLRGHSILKAYFALPAGVYEGLERTGEACNLEMVVNSLPKEAERLSCETQTIVPIRNGSEYAARVTGVTFAAYLDVGYWPLYELGAAFAKDHTSPIAIRDNDGSLLAIVMPMRLGHKLDGIEFPLKEEAPAQAGAQ